MAVHLTEVHPCLKGEKKTNKITHVHTPINNWALKLTDDFAEENRVMAAYLVEAFQVQCDDRRQ